MRRQDWLLVFWISSSSLLLLLADGLDEGIELELFTRMLDIERVEYNTPTYQLPEETIAIMAGDCEDIAILFGEMSRRFYGAEVDLLIMVNKYSKNTHAFLRINNAIYDPFYSIRYTDPRYPWIKGWEEVYCAEIGWLIDQLRNPPAGWITAGIR